MWHPIATERGPYLTRTRADMPAGDCLEAMDLGDRLKELIAIHEAAHAVIHLAVGDELLSVSLSAQTTVTTHSEPIREGRDATGFVTGMAAGERAGDRWLREQGLWTPVRAVAVEASAWRDRETVTHYTGLTPGPDYTLAHDLADAALDRHWYQVQAVAAVLIEHDTLTGSQVADLVGLKTREADRCAST